MKKTKTPLKDSKISYKKKLIEVSMPLETVNKYSKMKGFHTGIHTYWARRPLNSCKAVILASLIDDPSNYLSGKDAAKERKRIFKLIEKTLDENDSNPRKTSTELQIEIMKSTNNKPPVVLDPFCGSGTIPLAAQLLGLEGYGSDLNPVAVLITKSLIEIPHYFDGMPPVNPSFRLAGAEYKNQNPLAADLEYYGKKLYDKVKEKCEYLFEKTNTGEPVDTYIWCRAVKCSNPICKVEVPLATRFILSEKNNIYSKPIYNGKELEFKIVKNEVVPATKTGRGSNFKCPHCSQILSDTYIKSEGMAKRLDYRLMAVCIQKNNRKEYLVLKENDQKKIKIQFDELSGELAHDPRNIWTKKYGFTTVGDLFSKRQLLVIKTFCETINEIKEMIKADIAKSPDVYTKITNKGDIDSDEISYADAIAIYLSESIAGFTDCFNMQCRWRSGSEKWEQMFSRQTIPMSWDFAEVNPFVNDNFTFISKRVKTLRKLPVFVKGGAKQLDSSMALYPLDTKPLISTDPPYYDNIMYANLADFFYPIHRKNLRKIFPSLFSTLMTPKMEELVADQYKFDGDKKKARDHFKNGMQRAFELIWKNHNSDYPLTIYYAYKQTEDDGDNGGESNAKASTGWETMLSSLIENKFWIVGTLPFRTEQSSRLNALTANTLAASIVIVCRPRSEDAPITTRREFISELKQELPNAIKMLQDAGISPVDLEQSALGPGMSVYSKYSKVLEADGNQMGVRTALQLINQELALYLNEQESEMDAETRFAVTWFEQYGWNEGSFGDANTLATAKGTAVNALEKQGIVYAKSNKLRLLKKNELPDDWNPETGKRLTVWECTHHIIKAMEKDGEVGAAKILHKIGGLSEPVKELTYSLFLICDKKGWSANDYNINWQSLSDRQFESKDSEQRKLAAKDKNQKRLFED